MNILVAIKPVVDPDRPVHFVPMDDPWPTADASRMTEQTLLNPFDEMALEAAIRFRETGVASQVTVVTVGPLAWEDYLRTALAMGADRAFRVDAPAGWEPLSVAHCLAALAQEESVDLLLTGRQAVDAGHNQTGPMTAALLGWGQVTHAVQILLQAGEAVVLRETERGLERWAVQLPAVITVEWRLNAIHETGGPRYASLPNIMRARRKPLTCLSPDRWGLVLTPHLQCLALQPPPLRPVGQRLQTVDALRAALHEAGW
ncbi:MAG: electron transfer flavoprotein subunit beta/FixA family protein [Magnetococcales bacterium]|nr:electron transfer flavoprotein subunit beta/FixA family protein [Magnetococcales bacterium]